MMLADLAVGASRGRRGKRRSLLAGSLRLRPTGVERQGLREHALPVATAWSTAEALLAQPATRVVVPGEGHRSIVAELAGTPGLRSEDVPDIELAALAIEHGLVLASHDSGFRRFSGVRCVDPLA